MLNKLIGAPETKEFNGVTVTAVPLPFYEFLPLSMEHGKNIFRLGSVLVPLCVTDIKGEGYQTEYTTVDVAGSKRRVIKPESFGQITEVETITLILQWIYEINILTIPEKKS